MTRKNKSKDREKQVGVIGNIKLKDAIRKG